MNVTAKLPLDLPNPNVTGTCEVAVSFTCDNRGMERLNPLAMLPGSDLPNRYTRICQPCYDALADVYVASAR